MGTKIKGKLLLKLSHNLSSTIFCTQYRTEGWHARLGGGVNADAIMDITVWVETGQLTCVNIALNRIYSLIRN
jgi:hypothetical protein